MYILRSWHQVCLLHFHLLGFTHIYLIGRNKSCMNYTNEMMHVQNGQGEVVWFFFYMNVMVWLYVTITETSWHIKHKERTSCKPTFNRHDFMSPFPKINWCVLTNFMNKSYLHMCFNNNHTIRTYWQWQWGYRKTSQKFLVHE